MRGGVICQITNLVWTNKHKRKSAWTKSAYNPEFCSSEITTEKNTFFHQFTCLNARIPVHKYVVLDVLEVGIIMQERNVVGKHRSMLQKSGLRKVNFNFLQ